MQLINISTPDKNKPKIPKTAIGIDFGTTNSLVAIMEGKEVTVIPDQNGKKLIKSAVSYHNNKYKTGNEASESNSLKSVKRLVGKNLSDIQHLTQFDLINTQDNKDIHIKFGNSKITSSQFTVLMLTQLKMMAESYTNKKITDAVIAVPAYFNEIERQQIKDAATLSGLNVLRLINEPTAAAIAYNLQHNNHNNTTSLVYDLGGGTFDVSVLKKRSGVFQVLATGGDPLLGGDDIDRLLSDFIREKYKIDQPQKKLLNIAKIIKEKLTYEEMYAEEFSINGTKHNIQTSRTELNALIQDIINKTLDITLKTVKDANITTEEIDYVILVGGSTRIPLIKDLITTKLQPSKVMSNIDPDQIVVIGAAMQGNFLTSESNNNILIDVLPLSLGIETMGGLIDVMVPRNTPLPTSTSRVFTTFHDGQTTIKISVFQGEREIAKDNKLLSDFELTGITPLNAGKAKIEVQFTIDVDGLLTVEAMEKGDIDSKKNVSINVNHNLKEENIKSSINSSFQNAQYDFEQRDLIEMQLQAQQTITSVENTIKSNTHEFNSAQINKLRELVHNAQNSLNNNSQRSIINDNITELEKYFTALMNKKATQYLKQKVIGTNISQYNLDEK